MRPDAVVGPSAKDLLIDRRLDLRDTEKQRRIVLEPVFLDLGPEVVIRDVGAYQRPVKQDGE